MAQISYSFLKTSNGFVNAAPATPAVTDFNADLKMFAFLSLFGTGGRISSMISFTTTAVMYFGTVFMIPLRKIQISK